CLGRGGSDYTAALAAAALDAERLEIWTDVDGIFTADPRAVPAARPLAAMSFEEAMELAYFGAKVLHPKTIAPVRSAGIPVRIANSLRPEAAGTWVGRRSAPGNGAVRGLSYLRDVALLDLSGPGMPGVPGIAARAFGALARHGISLILITQGSAECAISFCVRRLDADPAIAALCAEFAAERESGRVDEIGVRRELVVLSAVGDGMRHRVGVAGAFFDALAAAGANVMAIAQGSSERSISAVLEEVAGPGALRAAHRRFCEHPAARPAPPVNESPSEPSWRIF
ncbi:MAG: aspartate kinase, partial [Acidobacteriota bacterium]